MPEKHDLPRVTDKEISTLVAALRYYLQGFGEDPEFQKHLGRKRETDRVERLIAKLEG